MNEEAATAATTTTTTTTTTGDETNEIHEVPTISQQKTSNDGQNPSVPIRIEEGGGGGGPIPPHHDNSNSHSSNNVSKRDSSIRHPAEHSSSQAHHNHHDDYYYRRWILFVFAFGCTSLVAGVIYGWPALRQQLQADGTTLTESQLGAVYTVGSWSAQGGRFFTGVARDKFGTRAVACSSLLCTVAGAIGVALADPSHAAALSVALFVMSLGAGCQLVMQPVGSLFPHASNAVISSLSGSFQVSGLVFLALTSLPMSRKAAFLGYAGVVALLTIVAWQLLPVTSSFIIEDDKEKERIPEEEEAEGSEHAAKHPDDNTQTHDPESPTAIQTDDSTIKEAPSETQRTESQSTIAQPPLTNIQQMISIEYLCLLTWFSISLIPLQYYVGSIGFQLESKGDNDRFYSNLFSIVYAASAAFAPAGGYLSDRLGLGITQALCTFLVAVSFFILGSTQISLEGQAAGLVCYSIGRMFVFGMFFSNIGRRFGYTHFGTLSGVGLIVSAVASLLQYPLIAAASNGQSAWVNNISGTVLLCLIPYCGWLAVTERRVTSAKSLLVPGG